MCLFGLTTSLLDTFFHFHRAVSMAEQNIVALTSLQVPSEAPMGICMDASFRLSSVESPVFLATHQTFSNRSPKAGSFCCQGSVTIVCLLPYPIFFLASLLLSGLGLMIIWHSDNPHIFQPTSSPNTSSGLQGNGLVEQWKHVYLPFTMQHKKGLVSVPEPFTLSPS